MKQIENLVSSNVSSVRYDEDENTLLVKFTRKIGDTKPQYEYVYDNVKDEEFQILVEAKSIGKTIRQVIKGKTFRKLEVIPIPKTIVI